MKKLVPFLASSLGVAEDSIEAIVASAHVRYRLYGKRKASGRVRIIEHPAPELKACQRLILGTILAHLKCHSNATAFRKGSTALGNARMHEKSRYCLKLDFSDFFHTVSVSCVEDLLTGQSSSAFSAQDDMADILRILTREQRLPMGAPTSPCLANAALYWLDEALSAYASERKCCYTRYADDIVFSGGHLDAVLDCEQFLCDRLMDQPRGLQLVQNSGKRHLLQIGMQRRITGLILSDSGVAGIGREKRRRLRSIAHRMLRSGGIVTPQIAGEFAQVFSVEPQFIDKLARRYGPGIFDVVRGKSVVPDL